MRTFPDASPSFITNQIDVFHVCRVLGDVALFQVGAAADLRTAKRRLKQAAEREPGAYIVFNQKTGMVVAETVSR